ncbi:hypothetical protein P3W24_06850 [Luteibacter sp. PPL201]|uniref:Uncharacterized protein n=1 Tax=Luteibacter sahnii TaxID=3021977 RepID=A0ABT6B972_9GAMM
MAEAKSAIGLVRDVWETVAHLGTLKGLLFLLSLAAFLDVAGVRVGLGNLMALQWKTPLPGPGTMLLALSVFIAFPLLIAPLVQGLLGYVIGFRLQRFFSDHVGQVKPRDDDMLASQLADLALFEKNSELASYVQDRVEQWQKAEDEADALMRQSWACTLWMALALLTDGTTVRAVVEPTLFPMTRLGYLVIISGLVIAGPWMVHLATDRFPLRYIHVPGARKRFLRMKRRVRASMTAEEAIQTIG